MKTNKRELIKSIFLKYLNDTHTSHELEILHQWVMDEENKPWLDELITELLEAPKLPNSQRIESDESEIWNRIYTELKPSGDLNKTLAKKPISNNLRRFLNPGRAAAMIALLVSIGIVSWFFVRHSKESTTYTQEAQVNWNEKKTNIGEKMTLTLPDGSRVKLNSLSSLRYPENFDSDERRIFLVGEAYFEIVKDEQKSFTVVSGSIETSVLGTSFNVKAFSDNYTSVAVTSGNVLVKDRINNYVIALEKDEMTSISPDKSGWHKSGFDYNKVIGWKDGTLVLENVGFEEILQRLESWYGVNFQVLGEVNSEILINTTYYNESLKRILQGLSFTYGFNFEIKDKEVIIRFES